MTATDITSIRKEFTEMAKKFDQLKRAFLSFHSESSRPSQNLEWCAKVRAAVADVCGFPDKALLGRRRTKLLADARQIAMFLVWEKTRCYMEVAEMFRRDHGTVMHAVVAVKEKAEVDPNFRGNLDAIRNILTITNQ
jgi:chromosomal replication initiation ATPase DnaA